MTISRYCGVIAETGGRIHLNAACGRRMRVRSLEIPTGVVTAAPLVFVLPFVRCVMNRPVRLCRNLFFAASVLVAIFPPIPFVMVHDLKRSHKNLILSEPVLLTVTRSL